MFRTQMTSGEDRKGTRVYGSPAEEPARVRSSISPHVSRDMAKYVQQALARFGSADVIQSDGESLVLRSRAGTRSVSLAPWADEWMRLEEITREKRAREIARELLDNASPSGVPQSIRSSSPRRIIFLDPWALVVGAVLLACGMWIAFFDDSARGSRTQPTAGAKDTQLSSEQGERATKDGKTTGLSTTDVRSSRVCHATMSRVFQGGSVTTADAEGWLVEVAVVKAGSIQPLDIHPALREFVQDPTSKTGSAFIWREEPEMAPVTTADTLVQVKRSTIGAGTEAVTLTFGGTLVDAYFSEQRRASYFHIATALSDRLQGTHAAVYARCFDQKLHALGSWFRGLDTGSAAAALVYFMGTFASPIHIAPPLAKLPDQDQIDRLYAFQNITEKTSHLIRADLATLVGQEGGMALGSPGGEVIITFPFSDGNRASRASRSVARVTSLGM